MEHISIQRIEGLLAARAISLADGAAALRNPTVAIEAAITVFVLVGVGDV
jgi:hypothetical protein